MPNHFNGGETVDVLKDM